MARRVLTAAVFLTIFAVLALAALAAARVSAGPLLLWPASALVIALMLSASRAQWPMLLGIAAIGSTIAGAIAGTPPLAIAALVAGQTVEALLAARLLQRRKRRETDLLREWLADAGAIGIAAPLAGACILTIVLLAGRGEFQPAAGMSFALAHSLGNLVFFPLFSLVLSGEYREWARQRVLRRRLGLAGLLMAVGLSGVWALTQPNFLPLLIPVIVALIATCRFGMPAASLSVVVLALAAQGVQTADLRLMSILPAPMTGASEFLAFYIALAVICLQPLARYLTQNQRLSFSLMQRDLAGNEIEISLQAKDFAITESRASYGLLADNMTDVILKTDREGYVVYASPSLQDRTGIAPAGLVGKSILELIHPSYGASFMSEHDEMISRGEDSAWSEYLGIGGDGEERWFDARIRCSSQSHSDAGGAVIVLRGIDDRKALEQQLFAAALTDPLTNLTNRRAFNTMLQYHLDVPVEGCLAIFDIDDFRSINREFGHEVGDKVLTTVAKLLRALLRKDDIISRIGGERFAVLLSRATPDEAEMLCQRVVRTLAEGSGSGPSITVSAGVSRIEGALDDTMKRADAAVVIAKAKGRNRLEMEARLGRRWTPDQLPHDRDR